MALRKGTKKVNITELARSFSTLPRAEKTTIFYIIGQDHQNILGQNKQYPFPGRVSSQIAYAKANVNSTFSGQKDPLLKGFSINKILQMAKNEVERPPVEVGNKHDTEIKAIDCPRLLRRDLKQLFPSMNFDNRKVSVISWSKKTSADMGVWSMVMEVERMQLTGAFIEKAKKICKSLQAAGFWADFIDPSSGRPYLGQYTNATLMETDERYNDLGFIVKDLGCCKVLEHISWGSKVFVGTIFTDAAMHTQIVKNIVSEFDAN